jgi:hypothetical protein
MVQGFSFHQKGPFPGFLFILYDYGFFMKMGVDPWVVVV